MKKKDEKTYALDLNAQDFAEVFTDDVEEEIRSIALDHIAYIAINMYGDQAVDMMKERFGRKQ